MLSSQFTKPCTFLNVRETFHAHRKGQQQHYCSASWCKVSNLNLVPEQKRITGKIFHGFALSSQHQHLH